MSFKNGHFIMDCKSKQYKRKIIALSALEKVETPPLKTWTLNESRWFDNKKALYKRF